MAVSVEAILLDPRNNTDVLVADNVPIAVAQLDARQRPSIDDVAVVLARARTASVQREIRWAWRRLQQPPGAPHTRTARIAVGQTPRIVVLTWPTRRRAPATA